MSEIEIDQDGNTTVMLLLKGQDGNPVVFFREETIREDIGQKIDEFAAAGYEGALASGDPNILSVATYIREALFNASNIARGIKDEE